MFDDWESVREYGSFAIIIVSFIMIAISGLGFGVLYFTMDTTMTSLQSNNCIINNNTLVSNCQDLFSLSFYPFLALKDVLIWFSIFFMFSLVLGMLLLGYQSGKSPILMGASVVFTIVITYMAIIIANMYRTLIENGVVRSMLTNFTVYNKIMLNFPWFVFAVGLFAVMLGFVNYQKIHVNEDKEALNY